MNPYQYVERDSESLDLQPFCVGGPLRAAVIDRVANRSGEITISPFARDPDILFPSAVPSKVVLQILPGVGWSLNRSAQPRRVENKSVGTTTMALFTPSYPARRP